MNMQSKWTRKSWNGKTQSKPFASRKEEFLKRRYNHVQSHGKVNSEQRSSHLDPEPVRDQLDGTENQAKRDLRSSNWLSEDVCGGPATTVNNVHADKRQLSHDYCTIHYRSSGKSTEPLRLSLSEKEHQKVTSLNRWSLITKIYKTRTDDTKIPSMKQFTRKWFILLCKAFHRTKSWKTSSLWR